MYEKPLNIQYYRNIFILKLIMNYILMYKDIVYTFMVEYDFN